MIDAARHRRYARRTAIAKVAAAVLGVVVTGAAPVDAPPPPVDYADPARWICRPGVDDGTCSAGLDALAIAADGTRSRIAYHPAPDPPIDCFYVYPTASLDPTMLSDLDPDAERRLVHDQAARFGARCRLFAPIYHQVTIAGLKAAMARGETATGIDIPYRDVRAAWRHYLAHDNHGRGVVLIGHSQGARILTRLIAREIEGRPARARLVAAYLAGDQDIDIASFRTIPPCRSADQTGCVVAWSSYAAEYRGPRLFGRARRGARPICVNPARPGGGRGATTAYLGKAALAPPGDPPYVRVTDRISAECVMDADGEVLRITIAPGADARTPAAALTPSRAGPDWGLHPHDIALVQGDMLDLIAAQGAAWARRR